MDLNHRPYSWRSAPHKQHDEHDDSDEDNRPNADIHDGFLPFFEVTRDSWHYCAGKLTGPGNGMVAWTAFSSMRFQRPMAAISEARTAQTGRSLPESVLDFLTGLLQVAL